MSDAMWREEARRVYRGVDPLWRKLLLGLALVMPAIQLAYYAASAARGGHLAGPDEPMWLMPLHATLAPLVLLLLALPLTPPVTRDEILGRVLGLAAAVAVPFAGVYCVASGLMAAALLAWGAFSDLALLAIGVAGGIAAWAAILTLLHARVRAGAFAPSAVLVGATTIFVLPVVVQVAADVFLSGIRGSGFVLAGQLRALADPISTGLRIRIPDPNGFYAPGFLADLSPLERALATPWPYFAALALWTAVPLALALWRAPRAPPSPPSQEASA